MKRLLHSATLIMLSTTGAWAQQATITQSGGWFESAYTQWAPVADAESYHVYYSGEGIENKKIDDQLIRNYGSFLRADVLGLTPGNYTLKVVPVINGSETAEATTTPIQVIAHDRTGFAFANNRIPGAYKADGTLKENAVVIYVTEKNKNTVTMDVITSSKGQITNCVGLQMILDGYKKGYENRPLVVRFIGQITDLATMYNGDIVVENNQSPKSFITLEGVGEDAVFDGWGVRIKGASNIEIRNVGTMNCDSSEGDNISLQQENDYIWVHNCDFFYGHAGGDSDQAKGDGALDCKKSNFVTFSYNHFWDSGKSNLLGLSEGTTDNLFITYHHNWYDHSDSRHPRVRFYSAHVYNNYYDGNAKYGVGSTLGSSVFVENNYFRNCKNPMMISMQGTDTKMGTDEKNSPTFSKEDGGIIKASGNIMVEKFTFVPYSNENTVHFDAYVVENATEQVPDHVTSKKGGNKYNNFDTQASVMYEYTAQPASEVVGTVTKYAGRLNGGDFKWTFDNAVDDSSYDLNRELKAALTSYKTKLVAIQGEENNGNEGGDGDGDGDGDGNNGGGNGGQIEGDIVHNFTTQGLTSSYFTINGKLSTGYGTVIYNDQTLTQCLKMESLTSVSFTTTEISRLTLLLQEGSTRRILINEDTHTATDGIVTVELPAGTHEIKKKDTDFLFLINIDMIKSGIEKPAIASVSLYPNPITDQMNISTDANIELVEIFSLTGVNVFRVAGEASSVDLSGLAAGIYMTRITTDKGMIQQRIIKK